MEPVGRINNLQRRNGRYYIRVRVPDDLRSQIKKREIVESLKTSDPADARQRVLDRRSEIYRDFERRRRRVSMAVAKIETIESTRALFLAWLEAQDKHQAEFAQTFLSGNAATDISEYLEILRDDAAGCVQDIQGIEQQVAMILAEERLEFDDGSPLRSRLIDWVREGLANIFERQIARVSGTRNLPRLYPEGFSMALSSSALLERDPLPSRIARGMTVAELISAYENDPARAGNSPKTKADYAVIFRALKEALGPKRQVRDITRQDCTQVRDLLMALPVHATKRNPGLTLAQIAEQTRGQHNFIKLSAVTVNSHLGALASLFRWAVKEGRMESNPAERLQIAITADRARPARDRFEIDELQRIFNAPLYKGCVDDEDNYAKPGDNHPRRGRFWVPLLALHMGMRLNECCQLDTADIVTIDEIQVIHIRATIDGRKRIKTKSSARQIPIHPDLLRLGFGDYVAAQREKKADRLFPELVPGKTGYYSDPFSKWFSRFLNSVGITRTNVGFHSFRHGFRDALRAEGVLEERVCELGGWSRGSEVQARYGRGFSAHQLRIEISKVSYPGLNLEHLVPRSRLQPVSQRILNLEP